MAKQEVQTERRLATMEQKLKDVCENIDEIKLTLNNFINSADKKYASKTTEKVVYGMIGVILTSVLVYVLKTVGIK